MGSKLPLGITPIDRKLNGGIPSGSIVVLSAPPASQSELLLYKMVAARTTLYLTTERSAGAVEETLDEVNDSTPRRTVRSVGGEDEGLDDSHQLIRRIPDESNVIVDAANVLEAADSNRYRSFLNALKAEIEAVDGIAFLHCLRAPSVPNNRYVSEHIADVVFELEQTRNGDELETRLLVPKFRVGRALTETIKVELTEEVTIDTSRDIA